MHDGGYRIRNTDNDHPQEPFDEDQTAESLAARFGNFWKTEDGLEVGYGIRIRIRTEDGIASSGRKPGIAKSGLGE